MIKHFLIFALAVSAVGANAQEFFYYYKNEKIELKETNDKLLIRLSDFRNESNVERLRQKIEADPNFRLLTPAAESFYGEYYLLERKEGAVIETDIAVNYYRLEPYVASAAFTFEHLNGAMEGISNEVVVGTHSAMAEDEIKNIADDYGDVTVRRNSYSPNTFHLLYSKNSSMNVLQIAALLYERGTFNYAEPNFFSLLETSCATSDPFFGSQWGLKNTGQSGGTSGADINVCDAWNTTKGTNVIVAIIDNGVDLGHDDLLITAGFDATGMGSSGGIGGSDYHGTACAGIVAARQNSIGGSGVAPEAVIMPIRVAAHGQQFNADWVADGINWAYNHGAAVLSNSYRLTGGPYTQVDHAINAAVTHGRNGFGSVVVFCTHNQNQASIAYPSNNVNVIAVGAMNMCYERKRSSSNPNDIDDHDPRTEDAFPDPAGVSCDGENRWGSNYGPGLSIMAPGVKIFTTDIEGSAGDNATDYKTDFNGTSAACPHVAGVAALMLSVNPCLTYLEVRDVIERSARKVGNYAYGVNNPNGSWDNEMGYGLVDAGNAVRLAHDIYKQNGTETVNRTYSSVHHIYAGEAVTGIIPQGKYTIASGAGITYNAPQSINLEKGFLAETGSVFLAVIQSNNCDVNHGHYKGGDNTTTEDAARQIGNTDVTQNIVKVYPNPSDGTFSIELKKAGDYSIRIVDMLGAVVYQSTIKSEASGKVELDSKIPAGNYFLYIIGNDNKHIEKITVIR